MLLNGIVTTGHKFNDKNIQLARQTAVHMQIPYVPRGSDSIESLRQRYQAAFVLVAKKGLLMLETPGGELFFHPNMAHLRVKNLRLGKIDHMVEAMGLKAGMSVLDCTLGFGADAIVSSFAVGMSGQVTGLEVSPWIAAVIGHGLRHFVAENYPIQEAMRHIQVRQQDYLTYLCQAADSSVDIVYFDPMFRHPLRTSANLEPLRCAADHHPVPVQAVQEAMRVARHRVVLKENSRSLEFSRLGFNRIYGGRYSSIHYGVIDV